MAMKPGTAWVVSGVSAVRKEPVGSEEIVALVEDLASGVAEQALIGVVDCFLPLGEAWGYSLHDQEVLPE